MRVYVYTLLPSRIDGHFLTHRILGLYANLPDLNLVGFYLHPCISHVLIQIGQLQHRGPYG